MPLTIALGLCMSTNDNTADILHVDTIADGVSLPLARKLKTFAVVTPAAAVEALDEEVKEKDGDEADEEDEDEDDGCS